MLPIALVGKINPRIAVNPITSPANPKIINNSPSPIEKNKLPNPTPALKIYAKNNPIYIGIEGWNIITAPNITKLATIPTLERML